MGMQQLHDYHREACLLCMRDRANIALALVRMACELSRDLILMSRNANAEQVWLGREEKQRDQYTKQFRFDKLTSPLGSELWNLYKIGCRFGVHGHMHFTEEPADRVTIAEKEFLLLPPDRNFSISCYSLTLAAIQAFMYAFLEQHGDPFRTAVDVGIRENVAQIVHHLCNIEIPFQLDSPKTR